MIERIRYVSERVAKDRLPARTATIWWESGRWNVELNNWKVNTWLPRPRRRRKMDSLVKAMAVAREWVDRGLV